MDAALRSDATPIEKLDALAWVDINALDRFRDEFKIQLAWLRQSPPDTRNPGWKFTTRLRQLKTLLAAGIRSGEIRIDSPSTGMLARCVLDVLWIPENILRAAGKRAALIHARDTVLRGVAARESISGWSMTSSERREGRRAPGSARPARLCDLRPRAAGGAGRARRAGVDRRAGRSSSIPTPARVDRSRRWPCRRRCSQPEACIPTSCAGSTWRAAIGAALPRRGGPSRAGRDRGPVAPVAAGADRFRTSRREPIRPPRPWLAALSREAIADPPDVLRRHPHAALAGVDPAAPTARRRRTRTLRSSGATRCWPSSHGTRTTDGAAADLVLEPRRRRRCGRPLAAAAAGGGAPARGGGSPGADAPTHRARSERAAAPMPRFSTANGGDPSKRPPAKAGERSIPSGTCIDRRYRQDWCSGAGDRAARGRTTQPSWCRTATACADRSPVSAWASIVIAGRRRATTSTSMQPSRRASS